MSKASAFNILAGKAPQYYTSDSTKNVYSKANKLVSTKSGIGKTIADNIAKYDKLGSFDPKKSAYYQGAYNALKQAFQNQGRADMQNTIAAAAANTGGYGNSYGTTAGNAAFQAQLRALAAKVPSLYSAASGEFTNQKNNLAALIGMQQAQQETALNNAQWQTGVQQSLDAARYQARAAQDSVQRQRALAELQYKYSS